MLKGFNERNIWEKIFGVLGFTFLIIGVVAISAIQFKIIQYEYYRTLPLFFFGLIFIGFYMYMTLGTQSVIILITSYFLIFFGYFESLFYQYEVEWLPYLFQLGLFILYIFIRLYESFEGDDNFILISLDSLFITGIITIFLDTIVSTYGYETPSMSISSLLIQDLPTDISKFLGVNFDTEFKIVENIISSMITIWWVSKKRKQKYDDYKNSGISIYSIHICILIGVLLIIANIYNFFIGSSTLLITLLTGCFGLILIYPNVKWFYSRSWAK